MKSKILFFLLLLSATLRSQTSHTAEFDRYLKKLETDSLFMGYVVLSYGDSIIYRHGSGYADIEHKIPFSENTLVCICSTGKIFTASIIMKLVQENKVSLEDRIGKFFPELPYGDSVTIRHLLTHTSGLGHYQENPWYYKNRNCLENIGFLKTQKLKFRPGEKTYYSTSGMILLGAVIEKLYHRNYIDVIRNEILIPNQMDRTFFQNYREGYARKDTNMAMPYTINDKGEIVRRDLTKTDSVLIPLAAGGQFSCAADLLKFDRALYSGKIIDRAHLAMMTEKQSKSEWPDTWFGLGFVVENADSPIEGAGHGGCDNVYYNHFKKQDLTLVIISIEGYANPAYSKNAFDIAEGIKKILFK
jgi:CubicO group peptidase (beta-lactamase class C family)